MIDKNGGVDYAADQLRMWKKKHEDMIRSLIKSNASPLALARKNTDEAALAQRMVDFMEGKGFFYVHAGFESHNAVAVSLSDVRQELTAMLNDIPIGKYFNKIFCIKRIVLK